MNSIYFSLTAILCIHTISFTKLSSTLLELNKIVLEFNIRLLLCDDIESRNVQQYYIWLG